MTETLSQHRPFEGRQFLLGVDLEDIESMSAAQRMCPGRLETNVARLLEFFSSRRQRCTFFVVGEVARKYPTLIAEIESAGHEIACHGDQHIQLDRLGPKRFRDDTLQNMEALHQAGIEKVFGFRAPTLSLTGATAWAYDTLKNLGFTYSSSVLPSRNLLYGWPGFERAPAQVREGVWEIPVTVAGLPGARFPIASGAYFRVLPAFMVVAYMSRFFKKRNPIIGYLHPYDIDVDQRPLQHPLIPKGMNWIMYLGRRTVLDKLDHIFRAGFSTALYRQYVSAISSRSPDAAS